MIPTQDLSPNQEEMSSPSLRVKALKTKKTKSIPENETLYLLYNINISK